MSETRHVCTVEDPWDESKRRAAVHPDAKCVFDGVLYGDEYERYECPNCKLRFTVEIGQ